MRNIAGFLVAVVLAAAAIFGYGYYNKVEAAKKAETIAAANVEESLSKATEVVPQKVEPAPAPIAEPKAEEKVEVAPQLKEEPKTEAPRVEDPKVEAPKTEVKKAEAPKVAEKPKSEGVDFDKKMKEYGLVDIRTLDNNILVELKYSTTDNFVGKDMYGSLERAYLERNFAEKVIKAQQILRKRYPSYTL